MAVLSVEDISKSYGDRLLFDDVTFALSQDDRVGLIGVNGSGKSTLLRVLMGKESADDGRIARSNDARIEYLSQNPDLDPDKSAIEVVLTDGPEAFEIVGAYEAVCQRMADDPESQEVIEEMTRLGEEMDRVDGWNLESEAKTILSKLGMVDITQSVGSMSGGQRKRVALARALLSPAELLILDEPTNHLDVDVIAWLEGYLARRTTGLLLITHDRYFLDRVTNVILELADQTIYRHQGNYSDFVVAREKRLEERQKAEQKRSQLAKKELAWLRRGPKARTTKNKARQQRANELLDTSYATEDKSVEIDTVESRLGKKVVILENISKSWDGEVFLKDFTYRVDRRDRLGIVGPNGSGKSTLLDIIADRTQADSGVLECGQTVVLGYYDQEAEQMDPSMRVHDYITEIAHRVPTSDGWMTATQMLDLFLFDKQKQWTYIEKLSGGEKRRLYLLRVLMGQPNVLLLDEPTNDLDVDTLTVLEDYLDDFSGAVITVSHDRYFLDRTIEHLLVFSGDGVVEEVPGNYSYYEERLEKERRREAKQASNQRSKSKHKPAKKTSQTKQASKGLSYREQKELAKLEGRIAEIEARTEAIDAEMAEQATDYEVVKVLNEEKSALEDEMETAFARWMELSEKA